MPPSAILAALTAGPGAQGADSLVVWEIRLPRAASAALAGALLALVGSAFQGLFRNPLAEPYIIGVSSGAAFGGTIALLAGLGGVAWGLGLPFFGFAGGIASLLLVLSLSQWGRTGIESILIAGVVIGSMLSALLSIVLIMSGQDANQVLRWLLGSVTPASWPKTGLMALVLAAVLPVLLVSSPRLNAVAISEDASARAGINVKRIRWTILLAGTFGAAGAVGATGVIPFLGLAGPHIARRIVGEDQRLLMPASLILGAALLLAADLLAQRVVPGGELPVGALTAVLGAPVLLVLLRARAA